MIKQIRYDDPRYVAIDGFTVYNPCGIEIKAECPTKYRDAIITALKNGWLVPFVNVKVELDYCI